MGSIGAESTRASESKKRELPILMSGYPIPYTLFDPQRFSRLAFDGGSVSSCSVMHERELHDIRILVAKAAAQYAR